MNPKQLSKLLLLLGLAGLLSLGQSATLTQAQAPEASEALEEALAAGAPVRVIVALHAPPAEVARSQQTEAVEQAQADLLDSLSEPDFKPVKKFGTLPGLVGEVSPAGLETLQRHPQVAAVALDLPVSIAQTPNAELIRVEAARQQFGLTGAGVTVAVLDTGVDLTHPDLAGPIIAQHCFNQQGCPNGEPEEDNAQDENGHGSHVAGLIVSQGTESPLGLAPEAELVAVRVLGASGAGFSSDVLAGIDWLLANQDTLNVSVLNLSFGGGSYSGICDEADATTMLYAEAVGRARAAGITVFAATGNGGQTDQMLAPACVSGVVAVGSVYDTAQTQMSWPACVDENVQVDQVACASNSSQALDLLAPGVQVASIQLGGGQSRKSGTSMSTPHGAAAAALLRQADPALTPAEIETTLTETGVPITDERTGRITPRLDVLAAAARIEGVGLTPLSGVALLQGRSDHRGSQIFLSPEPCPLAEPDAPLAVTGPDGQFNLSIPADTTYQCLLVRQPGYLSTQYIEPNGDLAPFTLPAGDVVGDERIDIFDLAFVATRYQSSDATADLNADGLVDIRDLTLIAVNYGRRGPVTAGLDDLLRDLIDEAGLTPLDPAPVQAAARVKLGQALFFDKELSGNRDVSCSTCHLLSQHSSDGLSMSIGVGGVGGVGPDRQMGPGRILHPRNSPDLFNRGLTGMVTMFWDGRVNGSPETGFNSPAGDQLPGDELESALAVLAMFPATARDEMRGMPADFETFGNELAPLDDEDFTGIWATLTARLVAIPEYVSLFQAAYPETPPEALGFQHAANAIAAFITEAFTFIDSPWDQYVAGDDQALSEQAKQGALLFFGEGRCSQCHSGNLFTDQQAHGLAMPQVGPGNNKEQPGVDLGLGGETGDPADEYTFRTPPLRNVALTGPWTHAGAYTSLEAVVRHHLDPASALWTYDESQLRSDLHGTFQGDEAYLTATLANLDPILSEPIDLTEAEFAQLMAFLEALTDPAAVDMSHLAPESVPSGLSIDQ